MDRNSDGLDSARLEAPLRISGDRSAVEQRRACAVLYIDACHCAVRPNSNDEHAAALEIAAARLVRVLRPRRVDHVFLAWRGNRIREPGLRETNDEEDNETTLHSI